MQLTTPLNKTLHHLSKTKSALTHKHVDCWKKKTSTTVWSSRESKVAL